MTTSRLLPALPFIASLISPLHAVTYSNWELFLTEGLAGLSNGTTIPPECIFEAEADVRQGASWTGNKGAENDPIPGTVVMDGKGYSISGAGYTFGGNYPKYTGNLTVRNWKDWSGFVQSGNSNAPFFSIGTGAISVENSTFSNNIFSGGSKVTGGVIYSWSTATTATDASYATTITGSAFSGNTSTVKTQGLVFYNSGTALITDSSFTNNVIGVSNSSASSSGGAAICNSGKGTMTLNNVSFSGNEASAGAAIYNAGSTSSSNDTVLTISNSRFEGNKATMYSSLGGAALYTDGYRNTITISDSTFTTNTANTGGAIMDSSGGSGSWLDSYTITGSAFSNNSALNGNGGAIATQNRSLWQIENSLFDANTATKGNGGAIWLNGAKTQAAIIDTNFTNNAASATGGGGALYIQNATAVIEANGKDVVFSGNTASSGKEATAIKMYGSSAKLYLNATDGRSVTFEGDGITGAAGQSLYINSAQADRDTGTSGTQSAATDGTVAFVRSKSTGAGATLSKLTICVEGGTLKAEGTTFAADSLTLGSGAKGIVTESCFDAQTSFLLEDAASATLTDCTFRLSSADKAAITMSAAASLTLSGTLTLDLSDIYSEKEEIILDENFILQFVCFTDSAVAAAFTASDEPLGHSAGLHTDGLTIALAYKGEEIAHTGFLNEEALTGSGTITFDASPGSAVPEPATATLSLLALAGLAARRRRK